MFPFVAGQVLALVLLTSYNVYQFAEYSFRELSYVTPLSVPPRSLKMRLWSTRKNIFSSILLNCTARLHIFNRKVAALPSFPCGFV